MGTNGQNFFWNGTHALYCTIVHTVSFEHIYSFDILRNVLELDHLELGFHVFNSKLDN